MADWTTGRSLPSPADISGPSLADITREEQAANEQQAETEKRAFRPRKDRGWYEGSNVWYRLDKRLEAIHETRDELRAIITEAETSEPTNRHERRRRAAIIRDAHHAIDRMPDR